MCRDDVFVVCVFLGLAFTVARVCVCLGGYTYTRTCAHHVTGVYVPMPIYVLRSGPQ